MNNQEINIRRTIVLFLLSLSIILACMTLVDICLRSGLNSGLFIWDAGGAVLFFLLAMTVAVATRPRI